MDVCVDPSASEPQSRAELSELLNAIGGLPDRDREIRSCPPRTIPETTSPSATAAVHRCLSNPRRCAVPARVPDTTWQLSVCDSRGSLSPDPAEVLQAAAGGLSAKETAAEARQVAAHGRRPAARDPGEARSAEPSARDLAGLRASRALAADARAALNHEPESTIGFP
jgi:hypothetical protein